MYKIGGKAKKHNFLVNTVLPMGLIPNLWHIPVEVEVSEVLVRMFVVELLPMVEPLLGDIHDLRVHVHDDFIYKEVG